MSDLYQQLIEEVRKREAELEMARLAFERSQEAAQQATEALKSAAKVLMPKDSIHLAAKPSSSPATVAAPKESAHPVVTRQRSFIDVVADSIQDVDTKISTALVFERLSRQQVELGDDPRTKISTALSRLEQRGALQKEVEGGIGRAHSYRKLK